VVRRGLRVGRVGRGGPFVVFGRLPIPNLPSLQSLPPSGRPRAEVSRKRVLQAAASPDATCLGPTLLY
jgi:hypothetical protein